MWLLALLMSSVVLLSSSVATAQEASPPATPTSFGLTETSGTSGATTPEEAVRRYLSGVAAADLEAVLAVTAIDAFSDGFRFDLLMEWRGAFTPTSDPSPPVHALYEELNRLMQAETIGHKLKLLVYSLLSSEHLSDPGLGPWPIRVNDRAEARAFGIEIDPARLARLDVVDVRFPDASLEEDPRWLELAERQARILGADELTQRLALVSLEGRLFDVGFTLVRYADDWKILDQAASLGGTDSWGAARLTTSEEYEARTGGETEAS